MSESIFNIHRYRKYYQKLEPSFKDQKTQAYIMVMLSLFTISFFGIFAIRPTLKTIASLQRQIYDRKMLNEKLDQKINSLIMAQEEYRRIEPNLPAIYSLMPDNPEFPLLVRLLENLAIQNSSTVSAVQFDPILLYAESSQATPSAESLDLGESIKTTPMYFTISFQGPYQNIVELLRQLALLDRLISLNSVNLQGNTENASLSLGVQSEVFYYERIL